MRRRNLANEVLAGSFLLFVVASVLMHFYKEVPVVRLFHFMTEAAVVGGVADWFAVTAIFRKPLGFPWHTALITRHRGRVINAVADMIEHELLSVSSIKGRIEKISIINLFINWVDQKESKLFFKNLFVTHSGSILAGVNLGAGIGYFEKLLTSKAQEIKVGPPVRKAVQWAVEHKEYEEGVCYIVDKCMDILKESDAKQFIYQQLLKIQEKQTQSIFEKAIFWLAEQTDSVNLEQVADAIYEELILLLGEAKNKDHVLYQWVREKLIDMTKESKAPGSWMDIIEEWKAVVLAGADMRGVIAEFAEIALESMKDSSNSPILLWLYEQSEIYWRNFTHNEEAKIWLESSIKQALYKLIENEHQLIGVIIHNVLDSFSDEDLNQFIEEKAGDDLQWIRINGCIVGAGVGFLLYVFLHYCYDQNVVPMIQMWVYGR